VRIFKRIKRPVDGFAEVLDPWLPNKDGAGGNCKMKLRLDVPGVAPQVVDYHEKWMVQNRWPEEGMRVAVTVDADRPDRVDVHWESVFGEIRGGVLGVGAELLVSAVGIDLDLSKGPPGQERVSTKPPADYKERIDELNARYAAGEITYEEMTAQLQRLLGGG
jgi:hypothetical protein